MKRLFLAAIIVTSAILCIGATLTTDEQPAVTKAVAPSTYPAIAKIAGAEGKVIVEVKINAAGGVTSAKGESGHRLLYAVSERAALQWKFAQGASERTARLTFTFHVEGDKDVISFIPPYEIEFMGSTPLRNTIKGH